MDPENETRTFRGGEYEGGNGREKRTWTGEKCNTYWLLADLNITLYLVRHTASVGCEEEMSCKTWARGGAYIETK